MPPKRPTRGESGLGTTATASGGLFVQQQSGFRIASGDSPAGHGDVPQQPKDMSGPPQYLVRLKDKIVGSRLGPSKIHAHRMRVLEMAFGVSEKSRSTGAGGSVGSRAAGEDDEHGGGCVAQRRAGSADLEVSAVEFSLVCPYSRVRMRIPVRSSLCRHVQCCDLDSWFVMLEKYRSMRDPMAPCPVCERRVSASSLEVDEWMVNALEVMPVETRLVVLESDGSFRSGDATRKIKRQREEEVVIDATQGPPAFPLSPALTYRTDAVDDPAVPSAGLAVGAVEPGTVRVKREPTAGEQFDESMYAPYRSGTSCGPPPLESAPPVHLQSDRPSPQHARSTPSAEVGGAVSPSVAAHAVAAACADGAGDAKGDDSDVVVVRYVAEPVGGGRCEAPHALPSQARLWVPHCGKCWRPCLKAETGDALEYSCCGEYATKYQWNLVRSIPRLRTDGRVSMELTVDGTLLLRGVDELTSYLVRGGFFRSAFPSGYDAEGRFFFIPSRVGAGDGVWYTTAELSRYDLDFLEACCLRVAAGESADDIPNVPLTFRYRRTKPRQGLHGWDHRDGAGAASQSQYGFRKGSENTPPLSTSPHSSWF